MLSNWTLLIGKLFFQNDQRFYVLISLFFFLCIVIGKVCKDKGQSSVRFNKITCDTISDSLSNFFILIMSVAIR